MKIFTIGEFIARLALMEADVKLSEEAIMEKACQLIEDGAKEAIGTYDFGWPPLAESTQEERVRQGYSADEPLLRRGRLKRSIGHVVGRDFDDVVGYVGTNDPNAKFMEFGTSRAPPRPFLGPATMHAEPEIEKMARKYVAGAISREGHEWLEVLHLAKEAAHHVKETVEDFVDEPEDERRKKR